MKCGDKQGTLNKMRDTRCCAICNFLLKYRTLKILNLRMKWDREYLSVGKKLVSKFKFECHSFIHNTFILKHLSMTNNNNKIKERQRDKM